MKITEKGMSTIKNNQEVLFEFMNPIKRKEINHINEKNFLDVIHRKENQISYLQKEILYTKVAKQLQDHFVKEKITKIQKEFEQEVCSNVPNAFWQRKTHMVSLPYEEGFHESKIPTKASPIQMNNETLGYCRK